MKRVSIIFLTIIVLAAALAGAPRAYASGTFSCGSLPSGVSCEVGTDYIRWTLTNVPRTATDLPYTLSAASPQHALITFDMTYVKSASAGQGGIGRYVDFSYGILDTSGNGYWFGDKIGPRPLYSQDPSPQTYTHTVTQYALLQPGTNRKLSIKFSAYDTPITSADTMSGTITVQLQAAQPGLPYFNGSPFSCGATLGSGTTLYTIHADRSDYFPKFVNTSEQNYLSLFPGSVHCYASSNYILWTFENVYPLIAMQFAMDPVVNGLGLEMTVQLQLCDPRPAPNGTYKTGLDYVYGSGYTDTATTIFGLPGGTYTLGAGGCAQETQFAGGFNAVAPGSGVAQLNNIKIVPKPATQGYGTARINGFLMLRAPSLPDPTATPTATSNATATMTQTATPTMTQTLTPTATNAGGGSGGGGGGGGGGGSNPTNTPVPTATFTRTPTATATFTPTPTATASGTATRTPTGGTPDGGGGAATSTPDWVATITALAGGAGSPSATAVPGAGGGTPDYRATLAALDGTPGAGGGGGGGTSGQATPQANAGWGLGAAGGCAAAVRVIVFVDYNKDNIMALSGEGVQGMDVYLRNSDFRIIRQGQTDNGAVKFCVPLGLAGQQVYVDIPYLLRSGSVQIPRQDNVGIGGASYGFVPGLSGAGTTTTLESIFRLDPPELPLYIP